MAKDLPLYKGRHFFLTAQSKRSFFITGNPNLLAYRTSINPTFYQTKVKILKIRSLVLFFHGKDFELLIGDYNI